MFHTPSSLKNEEAYTSVTTEVFVTNEKFLSWKVAQGVLRSSKWRPLPSEIGHYWRIPRRDDFWFTNFVDGKCV